jgi:hypothetical protein
MPAEPAGSAGTPSWPSDRPAQCRGEFGSRGIGISDFRSFNREPALRELWSCGGFAAILLDGYFSHR